jgi:hypothetical protein
MAAEKNTRVVRASPDLVKVSEGVFRTSDEAAQTLTPEERASFNEASQSVIDARQSAEAHEGLLRINQ